MKKLIAVLGVFSLLGTTVLATPCFADRTSETVAKVFVNVDPNVAVKTLTSLVQAPNQQTGIFSATVQFRVDANLESVLLAAAASPLFKGNDPKNTDVEPIPLSGGVKIVPDNANPKAGASNVGVYDAAAMMIDEFPGQKTNSIAYESSQNGHFSQDVYCTFSWNQEDPEKPWGEYSGKVKFYAMLQ